MYLRGTIYIYIYVYIGMNGDIGGYVEFRVYRFGIQGSLQGGYIGCIVTRWDM